MIMPNRCLMLCVCLFAVGASNLALGEHANDEIHFSIRSAADGSWSNPQTWQPARIPKAGDRVLIARGTNVRYDSQSKDVIRLIQVVGTLQFARDRDTELNVGLLKVQNSLTCSEDGFACDFLDITETGEPTAKPGGSLPALLVGTPENPIPRQHTARIRLHYIDGMNKANAPAIACCSARMEFHGAPLERTWLKLAADANPKDSTVTVQGSLDGWRLGDEIIVTASNRAEGYSSFRYGDTETEERTITKIAGQTITLDQPLKFEHYGSGDYRSEVANLTRNVVVESADPKGARGHTVYHRFSRGGISYARFAHLGKENVLGRYAIHFHLVGDTMRGSSVRGAAIVDSHNRWITIHGTQYLVVRDCVGYQSVGHGFFLEDGTEVYNLLDHNLGVQAYRGKRLPKQVLPFDPNDGAAFWWANGRNTITRNVGCENDQYGFRYDMQHSRYFDAHLPIIQPDGKEKIVDVRTIPIWRFEDNEAHTNFAGMVVAANGGRQPDSAIQSQRFLEHIRNIDWTGPDTQHPHIIRNFKIWNAHYAFRPHSPAMLMENLHIHKAAYGIYRPAFENHEYRDLYIAHAGAEPFNRGMDDASAQTGKITVDGLTFVTGYGNSSTPLIQISDNNLSGDAETHLRNVTVNRPERFKDRWPLINRGVGPRVPPMTPGVPIFIHDYFGKGQHAKVVSTAAKDLINDGSNYSEQPPLTANQSRVARVKDVPWPKLLNPIDDVPPATIVTSVRHDGNKLLVRGVSHDNGTITSVKVNGSPAKISSNSAGVADWEVSVNANNVNQLIAAAADDAGNVELTPHRWVRLGELSVSKR